MRSFVFVDTALQVGWLAERPETSDLRTWRVVAVTPDAAYACQQIGLRYEKFEDLTRVGLRRSEYGDGLKKFLTWRTWLDEWARGRVPAFGRTGFKPAESASFNIQRIHAEIWSTGRSLREFFDLARPEHIALWSPVIRGVPLLLQPAITPVVMLIADAARERGLVVRDLTSESSGLATVADIVPPRRGVGAWARRQLYEGRMRGSAAAFKSGGSRDALFALLPAFSRKRRVLACGFGFDLQRLVMELRRSGVGVDQIAELPVDNQRQSAAIRRAIDEAALDLVNDSRFWTLIEEDGVGRTQLWEAPLKRWWMGIVPRHWSAYATAKARFSRHGYQAVVVSNVGDEGIGGPISIAASEAGVRTYLYQHGGSANVDSLSLNAYVTLPDAFLAYGEGTVADFVETRPKCIPSSSWLVAVGSATLDELAARGQHQRHHRLRRQLQGSDPRPLVLYVPTHFGGYGRAVSHDLSDYQPTPYFELVQRVLSLWKGATGVRLVYKDFIVANDRTRVVPEFIRCELDGALVTTTSLRDLIWAVDAIVVDHVTTAALEVLLTDKPCVFYMPSRTPQAGRARELLRAAATVEANADSFVESVRALLHGRHFHPVRNRDRSFLRAYGTHFDDGLSARRAADVILQWRVGGQDSADV